MAQTIALTSGSIFAGNPITFRIQPNVLSKTPSFHRVIVEVKCGISGGNFETVKLTAPVTTEGNNVEIDVSSAIRVPLDSFEYSPDAETYPLSKWQLHVYDEYMDSGGTVHSQQGELYFPDKDNYYCCIAGAFSDYERLVSNGTKDVLKLSRKPTSSPELTCVGETYAFTPPYDTPQSLAGSGTLTRPASQIANIATEGAQTINGCALFALPANEAQYRQTFRFINSFGVLESVNVPRVYSKKFSAESTPYIVSRQETFSSFSRSTVKKMNDKESWLFETDPLDEEWQQWYLHEFLMSEHIWVDIKGRWIPCTVSFDDDITFLDTTKSEAHVVSFTAQLDINGSPTLSI